MSIIDISRALSPATAVWPGDRPVEWSWTARIEEGSAVNVGAVCTSTHAATHADAPLHFESDGASIDEIDLDVFVGRAQVIDATGDDVIGPERARDVHAPRVLFKTPSSQVPGTEWSEDFPAIAPATVDRLAEQSVVLVGVDAPSVDPVDSKDLPAHHALSAAGIVNLENLRLDDVAPGIYRLIALPLKISGADAAPVRAVLEPDPSL
jgi:arylformamidase